MAKLPGAVPLQYLFVLAYRPFLGKSLNSVLHCARSSPPWTLTGMLRYKNGPGLAGFLPPREWQEPICGLSLTAMRWYVDNMG